MTFSLNLNPHGSSQASMNQAPYGTANSPGLSSARVAEILAKILEKQNQRFERLLNEAQNKMSGGSNQSQGNVAMLRVQQAMGQLNTTQSVATACIQGMTDAQKETARASR